jgi:uncharacterized protein (TIGR02646 family)
MRGLAKSEEPADLAANAAALTQNYLGALAAGREAPRVWARPSIRAGLTAETGGRCAYCDARILHVDYGDIEHYRPRARYPALVVDWPNLTIACSRCNGHKSDHFDEALPYLNPFQDDPTAHLTFFGAFVFGHPGSARGVATVDRLRLNAAERIEARGERLRDLVRLVRLWGEAPDDAKVVFADEIAEFLDRTDYLETMSSYLRSIGYLT